MEQSGRLEMIEIELNQGIGRLKITFVELAADKKTPIQIPRENSPPRDLCSLLARTCMSFHTFSNNKLTTVRFMLAADELVPECPYNYPRRAYREEI